MPRSCSAFITSPRTWVSPIHREKSVNTASPGYFLAADLPETVVDEVEAAVLQDAEGLQPDPLDRQRVANGDQRAVGVEPANVPVQIARPARAEA